MISFFQKNSWRQHFESENVFYFFAFVGLFVFFGRHFTQGLSPDAALYSGLALQVANTGNDWHFGAGRELFSEFFEHPPFAFQWGSLFIRFLGSSDGVGRLIGALPAFLGFALLLRWVRHHFGVKHMAWTAFLLLTFGHYTKYATTFMLEAPLSTAVLIVFLASYELLITPLIKPFWTRRQALLWLCVGLSLSVAIKGVAGLGAWGAWSAALLLSVYRPALFHRIRFAWSRKASLWLVTLTFFVALLPFLLWAFASYPHASSHEKWPFYEYFRHQVLKSALSNRDNPALFDNRYHPFTFVQVILKYGWPWWWTVPAVSWILLRKKYQRYNTPPHNRRSNRISRSKYQGLAVLSWIFFGAFFVPFSLTKIQFPHYLHPTYLLLAPLGAVFFVELFTLRVIPSFYAQNRIFTWILVFLLGSSWMFFQRGPSLTKNRGQEFASFYPVISKLPRDCTLLVDPSQIDPYRMTAFALWYFRTHPWAFQIKAQEASSRIVFLRMSESEGISVTSVSEDCRPFLNIAQRPRNSFLFSR